ncbi:MAG: hypothetical protein K0Q99_284 [Clostridia bacterium]|jgi:DUF4097 and DUF4098 domain-containing protein YvlB|nr:hypothetical protein [Clostridia bacterium]
MEEKMLILKMLQEGKITAEEAHKLLEAVGKNNADFETDARKNEKKFEEKMQELQQKANKVAEKLGSTLNTSAEKFSSNSEKFGDDFAKRMEAFGNDIADSAVKFTDRMVNYLGNFIDVGYDKYQYNKNYHYELADNAEISVDTCNFAVFVNPTSENNLVLNLYVNTSIPNLSIEEYFKVSQTDNSISFKTQFPSRTWGKIEVMLPKHLSNLNIITTNGKCELMDITVDNIESNTSNGRISLINCQSKTIEAVTSNGKIIASGTAAAFADLSTSNGKIEIDNCKFDKLDAKTSNGSIILDGIYKMSSLEGNYNLRTSNGKIVIALNNSETCGCMIDAATSLGSISVDLPQLNYFVDKKSFTMQSTAQIKSANFDSLDDKIIINAHTSNSSIVIDAKK